MAAGPFQFTLLNAATTGTSQPFDARSYVYLTLYLLGAGTISAGTLIVEEAFMPLPGSSISQTWSAVTGANPLDCTLLSGDAQLAYQFPIGAYSSVRARIGTSISGGGTLTAVLIGTTGN